MKYLIYALNIKNLIVLIPVVSFVLAMYSGLDFKNGLLIIALVHLASGAAFYKVTHLQENFFMPVTLSLPVGVGYTVVQFYNWLF